MKTRRLMAGVAVTAATALVLAACNGGTGDDPDADPVDTDDTDSTGEAQDSSLTIGWNQSFYEYNNDSRTGNATANANILYLMNESFRYFDQELELQRNEGFGTFDMVSETDEGMTMEFILSDEAYWYGGPEPVEVDAADLMLYWAAHSGHRNTLADDDEVIAQVESELFEEYAQEGDDGEPEIPEEIQDDYDQAVQDEAAQRLDAENEVFFNGTRASTIGLIQEMPEIIADGKGVTFDYSVPYVDWEYDFDVGVPAHVVGMRALDIEDPQEAKDAVIAAIQDNDVEALSSIAAFWNTGFQFGDTLPDDELVYLSSGAYLMTEFQRDQYLTLTANEDYTGDRPAAIQEITVTISGDPMSHIQALQNQEVHLVQPQATPDTLAALENLGELVGVYTGDGPTYEHVTLAVDNGGPFDPETYGGDADTARDVRNAFLNLIPRQEIVETQVQPLYPEAEVRHSYTQVPGSPDYDQMVETNQMPQTWPVETDLDAATELLENAGVETPVPVRVMYDPNNARRSNIYELMRESVEREGLFELVDVGDVNWGSLLTDSSLFDASLFGWQSTSTAVGASSANYITGGFNNIGEFSSERVDELFDELSSETDAAEQANILAEVEQILVEEAFGTVLFQHELIAGYDSRLQNIDPIPLAPTIFWNYWEWEFQD
ncbi:ABC transporter substrate-binding protein [Pseudactinotalea sp. Z1732]|uniref:ABC transporter substrate-binding protein n=1 Tax=Pseudactinotalea sp. Z1732 TaxID=3413026 RepID=UPI003C7D29A0